MADSVDICLEVDICNVPRYISAEVLPTPWWKILYSVSWWKVFILRYFQSGDDSQNKPSEEANRNTICPWEDE